MNYKFSNLINLKSELKISNKENKNYYIELSLIIIYKYEFILFISLGNASKLLIEVVEKLQRFFNKRKNS